MKKIIETIHREHIEEYISFLTAAAGLSRLFSDSTTPFLHYRMVENIYCRIFDAHHIGRQDLSYDAVKDNYGIGLKTFTIAKYKTTEKIAEFNRHSKQINHLEGAALVRKIADLRNTRIAFANNTYGIDKAIYHCVGRQKNKLLLFNTDYDKIDTDNITKIKKKPASVSFSDGKNHYAYNFSKSTLYKTFEIDTADEVRQVDVKILADPYELLIRLSQEMKAEQTVAPSPYPYVILPLYSTKKGQKNKEVPKKSGLNQWNAGGRARDFGEVYIPIPSTIHQLFPSFFPPRDRPFNLTIPDRRRLKAKVCQENSKALMTNPNNDLADWLLRGIFALEEGKLMTYEKLLTAGSDSVKIEKRNDENFCIDFASLDAYENFISQQAS